MKIYLDNCCYNRPYDDQSQMRISLEAQAKLHIQNLVREGVLDLAASYMLVYENSKNRIESKKAAIIKYLEENVTTFIDDSFGEKAEIIATEIQKTGVKSADSIHTACAILAGCDYLVTTDDRLLKYSDNRIKIVDPTEFIRLFEGGVEDV